MIINNYNEQEGIFFVDLFFLGDYEIVFIVIDLVGNQFYCKVNFSFFFEGVVNVFCVVNIIVLVGEEFRRYLSLDEIVIIYFNGEFCNDVFEIEFFYVSCEDVGIQLVKVF